MSSVYNENPMDQGDDIDGNFNNSTTDSQDLASLGLSSNRGIYITLHDKVALSHVIRTNAAVLPSFRKLTERWRNVLQGIIALEFSYNEYMRGECLSYSLSGLYDWLVRYDTEYNSKNAKSKGSGSLSGSRSNTPSYPNRNLNQTSTLAQASPGSLSRIDRTGTNETVTSNGSNEKSASTAFLEDPKEQVKGEAAGMRNSRTV